MSLSCGHCSHKAVGKQAAFAKDYGARWDLVDLSRFTVKLKAEFQGNNRDMYRPEAIVASSAK